MNLSSAQSFNNIIASFDFSLEFGLLGQISLLQVTLVGMFLVISLLIVYIYKKHNLLVDAFLLNWPYYYFYVYVLYLAVVVLLAISGSNLTDLGLLSFAESPSDNPSAPSSAAPSEGSASPEGGSTGNEGEDESSIPTTEAQARAVCRQKHSDQTIHNEICGKGYRFLEKWFDDAIKDYDAQSKDMAGTVMCTKYSQQLEDLLYNHSCNNDNCEGRGNISAATIESRMEWARVTQGYPKDFHDVNWVRPDNRFVPGWGSLPESSISSSIAVSEQVSAQNSPNQGASQQSPVHSPVFQAITDQAFAQQTQDQATADQSNSSQQAQDQPMSDQNNSPQQGQDQPTSDQSNSEGQPQGNNNIQGNNNTQPEQSVNLKRKAESDNEDRGSQGNSRGKIKRVKNN